MILLVFYLLQLLSGHFAASFNLQTDNYTHYRGSNDSLFGFSIAFKEISNGSPGNPVTLLVGAPKASSHFLSAYEIQGSGAVFECSLDQTTGSICSEIPLDTNETRLTTGQYMNSSFYPDYMGLPTEYRNVQFLGATVAEGLSGEILACAPFYKSAGPWGDYRDPFGRCFNISGEWKAIGSQAETMSNPIDVAEKNFYPSLNKPNPGPRLQHSQSLFGFSLSSRSEKVLIGAPGWSSFRGRSYEYGRTSTARYDGTKPDTYSGYAVTSGRFFQTGDSSEAATVSSSPCGNDLKGRVIVYQDRKAVILDGEQSGSYFGAALLTADINGDGRDDLLVGAPTHTRRFDGSSTEDGTGKNRRMGGINSPLTTTGAVHVYPGDRPFKFDEDRKQTVFGSTADGRFGHSMVSMGDVNQDGCDDVAIGDPFGDKQGVVYIFLGSQSGLLSSPQQTLYASVLSPAAILFGWSMAAADFDTNGYLDLAIGAPASSSVFIFKARPVMTVTRFAVEPSTLKYTPFCRFEKVLPTLSFGVTICLRYGPFEESVFLKAELSLVSFDGVLQEIRLGNQTGSRVVVFNEHLNHNGGGSSDRCVNTTVTILSAPRDLSKSLTLKATISSEKRVDTGVNIHHAVENPQHEATVSIENPLISITPQLKFSVSPSTYVLGSTTTLNATVMFQESSRLQIMGAAVAVFFLPEGVTFMGVHDLGGCHVPVCSYKSSTVTCIVRETLPTLSSVSVVLKLMVQGFHNRFSSGLDINATLNCANCITAAESGAKVTFKAEPKFSFQGLSVPSLLDIKTPEKMDECSDQSITHIYNVVSQGPSKLDSMEVIVQWPFYTVNGTQLYPLISPPQISGAKGFCRLPNASNIFGCASTNPRNQSTPNYPDDDTMFPRVEEIAFQSCSKYTRCSLIHCKVTGHPDLHTFSVTVTAAISKVGYSDLSKALPTGVNVFLKSQAAAIVTSTPYAIAKPPTGYHPHLFAKTSTSLNEDDKFAPNPAPPWWWFVTGGVLVLFLIALIVVLLWKCGFFRRADFSEYEANNPVDAEEEQTGLIT